MIIVGKDRTRVLKRFRWRMRKEDSVLLSYQNARAFTSAMYKASNSLVYERFLDRCQVRWNKQAMLFH